MKHLFLASAAVLLLTGCGPVVAQKAPAKNAKPKKPAAKLAKPVEAAEKPTKPAISEAKILSVPPDAYAGVPEAIAALILAVDGDGEGGQADREERFRASAWLALQKEAAVEPLAEKLNDESVGLAAKIVICRTLGQIGPPSEATLIGALASDEQFVRINAAEQLAIIKPTNDKIVQTLVELTDHEDPRTAERAIKSLAHIGPPAKESTDRLLAILNSNADEGLRSEAKAALKKVNPRKTFQD